MMPHDQILYALLPELLVVIALFGALGWDYTRLRGCPLAERFRKSAWIGGLGLAAGLGALGLQLAGVLPLDATRLEGLTHGQLVLNPATLGLKALLYALGLMLMPLAARHPVTLQASEYIALLLLSTVGMGLVVTSRNLLGAFVALELVSLSLYALTALQHRRAGAEAALKYFTFGGVSSGFLLFGLSHLYGTWGTLDLTQVGVVNATPVLVMACLFVLVGLGFKIAVAPFHFWAPDVYQCAPTPVAGWVASGSKIAGVALLLALLRPLLGQPGMYQPLTILLATLATAGMVWGTLGALRQTNVKRLLAYSAVANAGVLLVAVAALSETGWTAALFYAVVYALAVLGAFAVVGAMCDGLGRDAELSDFHGCWRARPGIAVAFFIFVLSLAGIPPLAGFVGKFYLFFAAIEARPVIDSWHDGLYWLVALALVASVVALYYYLKLLKAFWVREDTGPATQAPVDSAVKLVIFLLAAAVLVMGLWPEPTLRWLAGL